MQVAAVALEVVFLVLVEQVAAVKVRANLHLRQQPLALQISVVVGAAVALQLVQAVQVLLF
jgi:hypothetical protein